MLVASVATRTTDIHVDIHVRQYAAIGLLIDNCLEEKSLTQRRENLGVRTSLNPQVFRRNVVSQPDTVLRQVEREAIRVHPQRGDG